LNTQLAVRSPGTIICAKRSPRPNGARTSFGLLAYSVLCLVTRPPMERRRPHSGYGIGLLEQIKFHCPPVAARMVHSILGPFRRALQLRITLRAGGRAQVRSIGAATPRGRAGESPHGWRIRDAEELACILRPVFYSMVSDVSSSQYITATQIRRGTRMAVTDVRSRRWLLRHLL
jgi:hypothetical protein